MSRKKASGWVQSTQSLEKKVVTMKALVEFCVSNLSSYTQEVMDALENDDQLDVDVLEYGCLGHCGECFLAPFALVDGEFVQADTAEELLQRIKQKVTENEQELKDFPY